MIIYIRSKVHQNIVFLCCYLHYYKQEVIFHTKGISSGESLLYVRVCQQLNRTALHSVLEGIAFSRVTTANIYIPWLQLADWSLYSFPQIKTISVLQIAVVVVLKVTVRKLCHNLTISLSGKLNTIPVTYTHVTEQMSKQTIIWGKKKKSSYKDDLNSAEKCKVTYVNIFEKRSFSWK